MRNLLAYLWLIGITFLIVSCTSKFTVPYHHPLAVSAEDRVSRAPMGTVTMDLDHSGQDSDLKLLLTLSNSTAESIQVPLSAKDDCYRDAFWFYAKTEMGWHPMIPALSAKCLYSSPGEVIPSGLEKELDLGSIAGSRGLDIMGPGSYMLRVKYTDPRGQEFLLYTDEFHVGTPAPIDEFGITVEKVASNTLDWKVTNHSNRSVWLAPSVRHRD